MCVCVCLSVCTFRKCFFYRIINTIEKCKIKLLKNVMCRFDRFFTDLNFFYRFLKDLLVSIFGINTCN